MPVDPRIQAAIDAPLKGKPNAPLWSANKRTPKGYGGVPGTGPADKKCNDCMACAPTGCDKRNWVCQRPQRDWERGTFIHRFSPACRKFEARHG